MKKLITLILSLFIVVTVFPQPTSMYLQIKEAVGGTYTYPQMTLVNIGTSRFTTNYTSGSSNDLYFVYQVDNGYNSWGSNVANTPDLITVSNSTTPFTAYFNGYNSSSDQHVNRITGVSLGHYYFFSLIQGSGYTNENALVQDLSATPVTIPTVTDNNSGAGTIVTVSITTSGTPPAEQNIFVRYTTDNWANWSIVQATGSGTSWTATIPASGNVGPVSTNLYYVYSSTLSLATEQGLTGSNIDLSTINLNNNGGNNFPLPVELTSFSALIKNKSVNLVWHTATEVNNYGFEIQRQPIPNPSQREGNGNHSPFGGNEGGWSKVGFVNGNGNSSSPKDYNYTDKTVATGKYLYRLKQIDNDGKYEYSKEVEVDLGKPTTFALNQNYPNPFNPTTSIQYSVSSSQFVSLKVFNVLGKEVAVLVNEKLEPGTYTANFSAANLSGGAYFYRLQAGEFVQTKKMILLK